jgi:hypothetical protein
MGGRIIIGEFGSSIAIGAEDKYFFVFDDTFIGFI